MAAASSPLRHRVDPLTVSTATPHKATVVAMISLRVRRSRVVIELVEELRQVPLDHLRLSHFCEYALELAIFEYR